MEKYTYEFVKSSTGISHLVVRQPSFSNGRKSAQLVNFRYLTDSLPVESFFPASIRSFAVRFVRDNTTYPVGSMVALTEEEIASLVTDTVA